MPKSVRPSSATSLPEKLIKIGAKVVSHGRCVTFQMVEVAVPGGCSGKFCRLSPGCGCCPRQRHRQMGSDMVLRSDRPQREGCALRTGKLQVPALRAERPTWWRPTGRLRSNILAAAPR